MSREILFSLLHSNPYRTTHHLASTHSSSAATAATRTRLNACPSPIISSRPHVLVWLEKNEVDFWREQTRQHHRCTYAQAHTQAGRLNFVIVTRAEIDCNRCEEHNAGRVHRKADILSFVEILRNLSRLESVDRTEWDEEDDEDE